MKETNTDPLISATDARKELGNISPVTLWRWTEAGLLPPPRKVRGRKFWLVSEIDAFKTKASTPGGIGI